VARQLIPAGVFYVNLRGKHTPAETRAEALANAEETRKVAYRHSGRFDLRALAGLDARPDRTKGDQFNFRLNQNGSLSKNSKEAMEAAEFTALLDLVEGHIRRMGQEIFAGEAGVSPFRRGSLKACDQCACQAVCRIDPWEHPFRVLRKTM